MEIFKKYLFFLRHSISESRVIVFLSNKLVSTSINICLATTFIQQYFRVEITCILKLRDKSAEGHLLTSREELKIEPRFVWHFLSLHKNCC